MSALHHKPFAAQKRRHAIDPIAESLGRVRPYSGLAHAFANAAVERGQQFGGGPGPALGMLRR